MTDKLSRRDVLSAALAAPLLRALPRLQRTYSIDRLRDAPARVVAVRDEGTFNVALAREWTGDICRSRVTNRGTAAVAIKEVVLFDLVLDLPPSTPLYGESFQMLSQSGGTLGAPKDLGSYTDAKHYKIPTPPGAQTYFGAMTLSAQDRPVVGLGFTSTRRFAGLFRLQPPASLQVVIDTEGLSLGPGQSWDLEEFTTTTGESRDAVLGTIGARLATNHPRLHFAAPPTGWCSWYCFGPRVTAQNILDNLDVIAKRVPGLRYVQIDDGYQPAMGDWLETGAAFGGDVRKVLDAIRQRGFEPAIWVAPFVAEEHSHVFEQHRDWFVKDTDGSPLRSDKVTFGGWRRGPWYVLDGTHRDVQTHFERLFRTMRQEWGVTYFKLDANFWGAIHGGRFNDPQATRIEAYRRGMQAIAHGAGDSFILGCNHPIWASAGLIHGSRSSNDIKRTWDRIKTTAEQNLLRNWQNGRLWWNDPDAVVLTGDLPENEFIFHATAIYATGGMLLSGDDLTSIPEARLAMLKKLLPPTGIPAVFEDENLRVGTMTLPGRRMLCVFNWTDAPATLSARLTRAGRVADFWTGEPVRVENRVVTIAAMPAHSARLLECVDA
ncbi:MAG TPA: glycoside hydrolase family 36 protein [Vicinamibacterales bacterium]|nr:glycoside hydrolase family 36 protein [Vicinamibacterales bacterium]